MSTNNEATKTPEEIIKDFIEILVFLGGKIRNNSAIVSDYKNFEEMVKMLGAPDTLKEVLTKNGFSNWDDYFEERKKNENDRNIYAIKSVEGAISGISMAAINVLNNILKQDNHPAREKEHA